MGQHLAAQAEACATNAKLDLPGAGKREELKRLGAF